MKIDMNKAQKEKTAEETAKEIFGSWIQDLEEKEQPETCGIEDGEDCVNCGS